MRDERVGILELEAFKKDYDWSEAFSPGNVKYSMALPDMPSEWNGNPIEAVTEILAQAAGENDEEEWVAVVRLGEPFFCYAVVSAWCDYTGWDCQSGGHVECIHSANAACSKMNLTDRQRERLGDQLRALAAAGRIALDWDVAP